MMRSVQTIRLMSFMTLAGCVADGPPADAHHAYGGPSDVAPDAGAQDTGSEPARQSDAGSLPQTNQLGQPLRFGFWGNAVEGIGEGNAMAETASFSNLVFVRGREISKLREARERGLKAILMVQDLFFPPSSTVPRNDYRERFVDYWRSLSDFHDVILGFYLYDEPLWRNSLSETRQTTDRQSLHDHLRAISRFVRRETNRITALTHAYVAVERGWPLVRSTDWTGINCYAAFGPQCSEQKLREYFRQLIIQKAPSQRIMATVDAFRFRDQRLVSQQQIIQRIDVWMDLVHRTDQVAAITPFLYQNDDNPREQLQGAETMPDVLERLEQVGRRVIRRSRGECVTEEPRCEGFDSVRRDSCGSELERWRSAPHCRDRIGPVRGTVDDVSVADNGWVTLEGWVCAKRYNDSIPIHVYVGSSASNGGQFIVQDQADRPSEVAVDASCGTAATAHRFQTWLHPSVRETHGGEPLYVHGIHPTDLANRTIANSGTFDVP
jgi:hypothetical protein